MSKHLVNALNGEAWSVSGLVFDLNDKLDDEGRPLSERRAVAAVRAGVEMEMRECPYKDARHGKLMNVSALEQIAQHFDPVLADIAAFRRQLGGESANWFHILAGVLDQLAGPAFFLLEQRDPMARVPTATAVGHKLAEGYFGVLRGLHESLALDEGLPVTSEALLARVVQTGALIGQSEVCAGSTKMLQRATEALIDGRPEGDELLPSARLERACCLALQVQLGILWDLYDRAHLAELMCAKTSTQLVPANDFLRRKLASAVLEHGSLQVRRPGATALPAVLTVEKHEQLGAALQERARPEVLQDDLNDAMALLQQPGSVLGYTGNREAMAQRVACYLHGYRLFKSEISRLELELRRAIGYDDEVAIQLGGLAFPLSRALPWYELILGRRMGNEGRMTGTSTGLRHSKPL